jgi:hypothetical protein
VPDHHLFGRDPPGVARERAIAAGALGRFNAESLKVNAVGANAERFHHRALALGLDEDAVGLPQEPGEVRSGVLPERAVARVVGIAPVKERRDEEQYAASACQTQRAVDRKGIWEGGRVDGIEGAVVAPGVAPHRWADGVTGRGQALQRPDRDERGGF